MRRETVAVGLVVLAAAIPTAIFSLSLVEFVVMPDELGYMKQAVAFGRGEPQMPGDFWFNSWAQLTPLLLSPLYKLFDTTTAFDLAHILQAIVFASAAVPVWLLARRVIAWTPAAVLVAACAVAIPWIGMAGTVMTEPLAYALSAWALVAMVRAVAEPGPLTDLLAIVALGAAFLARTQLVALAAALLLAILMHELLRPAAGPVRARLRRAITGHRLLWVVIVIAAVAVLAGGLEDLLGNYIAPTQESLLPAGTFAAARELLTYVVVGIAVLPLPLGAAWAATTLGRATEAYPHAFACVSVCVVTVLTFVGASFTVGFTAGINDRYLFYVIPPLFVGMAAALLDRRRGLTVALIVAGALTALVVGFSQLAQVGPSLVSPSMAFHAVLPGPGTIAIVSLAAVILIALAATRVPERAMLAVVGGAVLAFGVIETQYTLRQVAKTQQGASEEFIASRNWIDRVLPENARAASVLASFGDPLATSAVWWDTSFWNKSVERVFHLPGGGAYAQGFARELDIDPATGRVPELDGYRYIVRAAEDARFGLRGSRTLAAHAGVAVIEAQRPYEAEWLVDSPESVDGEIAPGTRVTIKLFPRRDEPIERVTIDLRVRPVGSALQSYLIESAGRTVRGRLEPGNRGDVQVPVEFPANGPAKLAISAGSAEAALRLLSVLPAA